MAKLYITEFTRAAFEQFNGAQLPCANLEGMVDQTPVAIGAEADSAAFATTTAFVRVHADAACSIAYGLTPMATTNNMRMAADQTEYFGVTPGKKISVIANT
jgi:hypothetical protein